MKKVLIFGVAGFVGGYLVKEFAKAGGYHIYGSDMVESFAQEELSAYYPCDILDGPACEALIESIQPDYIINLAALSSVRMSWDLPEKTIEINVLGAMHIMDGAVKLEKKPVLLMVGSSEEYEISDKALREESPLSANNPYGISKATLEQMAEIYRMKYKITIYFTRSFNHTGVGQKPVFVVPSFAKQVAEIEKSQGPGVMKVGNLSAMRDISDVRDVVCAYRMILESGSKEKVFNVGSGKASKIQEILEILIGFSSYEIKVEQDPDKMRPSDNPFICADNTLLKKETGWSPKYSIEDTVKALFDYYVEE